MQMPVAYMSAGEHHRSVVGSVLAIDSLHIRTRERKGHGSVRHQKISADAHTDCRRDPLGIVRDRADDVLSCLEDGVVRDGSGGQSVVQSRHHIAAVFDGVRGADAGGAEVDDVEKSVAAEFACLSFLQSNGRGG